MDTNIKSARDAELQIASIVVRRGIEGKDSWESLENAFYALIENDLSATLMVDGKSLTKAERWDALMVQQGQKTLVLYYYPTPFREAVSQNIAPAAIKDEIDKLFQRLMESELHLTYGPALERLRSLK